MIPITENELQNEVIKLLNARPELVWIHVPDSRKLQGTKGFPDLLIVGPHGILWRELKSRVGKLRSDQVRWKYLLQANRANYAIWTEWDLLSGGIGLALDRITYGETMIKVA